MKGVVLLQRKYNTVTSAKVYSLLPGLLVVGKNKYMKEYYILKMKRAPDSDLAKPLKTYVTEEEQVFTKDQVKEYLKQAKADPKSGQKVYGLLGFIKFLAGYYLVVITQRQRVCKICKNSIYCAKSTNIYPLFVPNKKDTEYLDMLNLVLQTSRDFYFSYTYDLTSSLQDNVARSIQLKNDVGYNTEFVWNSYLLSEFTSIVKRPSWILPVTFGFVGSATIRNFAFPFSIHIIARRSRFYAGTRYLTRGVNEEGKTGNFVEIEQIVEDQRVQTVGMISASSYVHIRGSIPVLWRQGSAVNPKPEIILNEADYMFALTKLHISDLIKRYGKPLFLVNLTKLNSKREERLSGVYRKAVKHISDLMVAETESKIDFLQYKHVDLSAILRSDGKRRPLPNTYRPSASDLEELLRLIKYIIEETGMFLCRHKSVHYPESELFLQKGVIRSNCIDCLDRTNSFQLIVGRELIKKQLKALGILATHLSPKEDSNLLEIVNQLYENVGDALSLQYAGSKAHKRTTSVLTDIFTSAKRYFSNAARDNDKQKRINLFLGIAVPFEKNKSTEELLMPIPKGPCIKLPTKTNWMECLEMYHRKLITQDILTKLKPKVLEYLKEEQSRKEWKYRKPKDLKEIIEESSKHTFSIVVNEVEDPHGYMEEYVVVPVDGPQEKNSKSTLEGQKKDNDFIERYLQACANLGELTVTSDNKIKRRFDLFELYKTVVKNPNKPGKTNVEYNQ